MALSDGINRISTALHTSRVSREYGIDALVRHLREYLPERQIETVRRAYEYGERLHRGQYRKSGEPYIYHPLAVARILADMRLDATTLTAAILHDVIEDTEAARGELAQEFGEEVAVLVDGVSKLDKAQFYSRAEAQGENFRKLLMAMTRDIRVILVKLADRLHNMRTLGSTNPEQRRRVARETLEIFAPIARRLGINALRHELEDLGFANLYPNRYAVLKRATRAQVGDRRTLVREIEETLARAVAREGIDASVTGRRKGLYSIYRKMRAKQRRFLDIFDVYGFRIVVDSVDACYRVLGIVHHCYRPINEQFNDFIANPKVNGYQSLHTALMARGGIRFEVQIRTMEMDQIAESGIAAHWQYKLDGATTARISQNETREWLGNLLDYNDKEEGDSVGFLDNVRVDLVPDEVYVFTPQGAIMRLPRGSTCVDFAYAVHTDLGNRCVAARVDNHLAPLNSQLESGQVVEVITAKHARPNVAWLHFLRTAKARTGVRQYLKGQREDKSERLGQRLLDKALREMGMSLRKLPSEDLARGLAELQTSDIASLYREIGLGRRLAPLVARHFLPPDAPAPGRTKGQPLSVEGTEGLVVEFAKCCHPVPGDAIHGLVSAGRGLVVHRFGCRYSAGQARPADRVELSWSEQVKGDFPVELRVQARNERGAVASVTAKLADAGCNIEGMSTPEFGGGAVANIRFLVSVENRRQLALVIRRLRRLSVVERVARG